VRFSGYDPTDFKAFVFAVSAGLAILGRFAPFKVYSSPRAMDIAFSIEMAIWVAVGGRAVSGGDTRRLLVNSTELSGVNNLQESGYFFRSAVLIVGWCS